MTELVKLWNHYFEHEFDHPSLGSGDIATFARRFKDALSKDCKNAGFKVLKFNYDEGVDISAWVQNISTERIAHLSIFLMSGCHSNPLARVRYERVENVGDCFGEDSNTSWLTKLLDNIKRITA